jgi:hypothetical protein
VVFSSTSFAQEEVGKKSADESLERQGFVDPNSNTKFLESLGSVSRQTAISKDESTTGIKAVLDLRIPMIEKDCDMAVSHQFLKLGYAVHANFPKAEFELRRTSEEISRKTDKEFSAISASCKKTIRGFAFAILKIYLGSEWNPSDDRKQKNDREDNNKTDGGF